MLNRTKELTVINLDKLVEEIVEVGGHMLKRLSYEELEKKLLDNPATIVLGHDGYYALFTLIAGWPQQAIWILEKAAKYHVKGGYTVIKSEKEQLKKAIKADKKFVKESRAELRKTFAECRVHGPTLHSWITCQMLAIVKSNPAKSLDFFQECYELMLKNNEEDEFWSKNIWDENNNQIRTILEGFRTRKFAHRGKPHHLELMFSPKEEKLEVPNKIQDSLKLSKYFMKQEEASLDNIAFIEDEEKIQRAVIIPCKNDTEWKKGLYIVLHKIKGDKHIVYKTEKFHTDEELIAKTTGEGTIIRYESGKKQMDYVLLDII